MPNCKNCGARLTKFDSDICPVCGTKKPLEGMESKTNDITSQFDSKELRKLHVNSKKKSVFGLLLILFGFLGLHFFYIQKPKKAIIQMCEELGLGTACFFASYYALNLPLIVAILTPILTIYILNIILALMWLSKSKTIKDGNGNLVQ